MPIPKAFISYSHDTLDHKKWVLELAIRLRNNGIDAILDQFELKPGDDLPHFMETNLAASDNIIMICTDKYVQKANQGEGGVGYEKMIITSNLMKKINENKIIPIIRQNQTVEVPTFLKTKLYINFSKKDEFEYSYDDLVRTIHKSPLFKKTPVGNNPFQAVERQELEGDNDLIHDVLKAIAVEYEKYTFPFTDDITKKLNISRVMLDIAIMKLIKMGYVSWFVKNRQVELTDQGKLYLLEKKML